LKCYKSEPAARQTISSTAYKLVKRKMGRALLMHGERKNMCKGHQKSMKQIYTSRSRAPIEKHPVIDKLINLRSRPACRNKTDTLILEYKFENILTQVTAI
jgi:hypothetical protein